MLLTATAKPAIMKMKGELHGETAEDFAPFLGTKVATAPVLRDAIAQQGVEVLGGADTLFPSGAEHGGWAEFGQIDAYGHAHPDEVNLVVTNDEHEGSAAMVVLID